MTLTNGAEPVESSILPDREVPVEEVGPDGECAVYTVWITVGVASDYSDEVLVGPFDLSRELTCKVALKVNENT